MPKKSNKSNKPGFSFSCLLWAIAIRQHSPRWDFQPLYSALSAVCSETAFDMQRLLQVHALRQVENRRAFPTRRSSRRKNILPHLFDSLLIFPIAKSSVHGEIDLANSMGLAATLLSICEVAGRNARRRVVSPKECACTGTTSCITSFLANIPPEGVYLLSENSMAELFTLDEAAAIAEIEPDTVRTALEKRAVTPSRKVKTGKAVRYQLSEGDVLYLLVVTEFPSPLSKDDKDSLAKVLAHGTRSAKHWTSDGRTSSFARET